MLRLALCAVVCNEGYRDKKSIDGMAKNQCVLALNRHAWFFLKVTFVCNGVSGNVNPCAQVPAVSRKCADGFS